MQSGLEEEVFDKPITIFAPDNAAFAEFTEKSMDQFEQFSVPELKRIITKHIIPGTYELKDLQNLKVTAYSISKIKKKDKKWKSLFFQTLTTINGETLTLKKETSGFTILSNSGVTEIKVGDIETEEIPNAIIHIVDSVLS